MQSAGESEKLVEEDVYGEDEEEDDDEEDWGEPDENGFVIKDGVLVKYKGAGGDVVVPDSVTSIGDRAFENCISLKKIIIPDSVTFIDEYAISSIFGNDGDHYTDTTTIYCSKGSTAEAYALAHNIPFVYLEDAVSKTPTITVSAGISIEKTAGDAAFSLGVSIDSDGKVTYSSDNENVVKVDSNGNVAVMGAGTANIIIKTAKTAKYEAAEQKVTIMVKEKTNNAGTTGGNNQPGNSEQPGNNNQQDSSQQPGNTETPGKTETPGNTETSGSTQTPDTEIPAQLKKGDVVTDKKTKATYMVTDTKKKTVAYKAPDKKAKAVTVPAGIKINGVSYKVTSIAKKAFYKNKKITSVTIGNNVTVVNDSAFEGCTKLSKVTIGTGVTKIGAKAFKSCKKLGTVKISSKKLKSVGKQAFKGTKTDIKVTVPAKKQTAYKKLLKNSGISRKSKIKK